MRNWLKFIIKMKLLLINYWMKLIMKRNRQSKFLKRNFKIALFRFQKESSKCQLINFRELLRTRKSFLNILKIKFLNSNLLKILIFKMKQTKFLKKKCSTKKSFKKFKRSLSRNRNYLNKLKACFWMKSLSLKICRTTFYL